MAKIKRLSFISRKLGVLVPLQHFQHFKCQKQDKTTYQTMIFWDFKDKSISAKGSKLQPSLQFLTPHFSYLSKYEWLSPIRLIPSLSHKNEAKESKL